MTLEMVSPRIGQISWGRIELEGGRVFKDVKLFPGGAREWDWRETGTRHEPGIQPGDVEELLERGAKAVVLGIGMNGRMRVCPETLTLLADRGVDVDVLPSDRAAARYNELALTIPVAAVIHTTC